MYDRFERLGAHQFKLAFESELAGDKVAASPEKKSKKRKSGYKTSRQTKRMRSEASHDEGHVSESYTFTIPDFQQDPLPAAPVKKERRVKREKTRDRSENKVGRPGQRKKISRDRKKVLGEFSELLSKHILTPILENSQYLRLGSAFKDVKADIRQKGYHDTPRLLQDLVHACERAKDQVGDGSLDELTAQLVASVKTAIKSSADMRATELRLQLSGIMEEVEEYCKGDKNAKLFLEPVDLNRFPAYLERIGGVPMDLSTISKAVQFITDCRDYNRRDLSYQNWLQFLHDVELMVNNCHKFNGLSGPISNAADDILVNIKQKLMDSYDFVNTYSMREPGSKSVADGIARFLKSKSQSSRRPQSAKRRKNSARSSPLPLDQTGDLPPSHPVHNVRRYRNSTPGALVHEPGPLKLSTNH
jgi:hypothetical protein